MYGAGRTDSTDYRTTVHRLAQKPGAWRNSPLRQGVPTPVRVALDAAARVDLQAALQGLAQCTDQWGFDHAVRALEEAVALGRTASADIITLGRRMALAPAQLTAGPVDLRQFDVFLEGREAE